MLSPDVIEINDEQAQKAKVLSSPLSEVHTRKRAMIDMLGINCAISYLYTKQICVETKKSIYKIPKLFEEFKISDIYYNNYRIDIITLYQEKTVKIPKIHHDDDILPDFYFVVQIGSRIKEAKMIGFMEAQKVIKSPHDSTYYYPGLNLLFDTDRFRAKTRRPNPPKTLTGKHSDCLGLFLKFVDDDLSSVYKRQMIQHIMNCDGCRENFVDMMEFERLANNVRAFPDLIDKYSCKRTKITNPYTPPSQNEVQSKFSSLENADTKDVKNNPEKVSKYHTEILNDEFYSTDEDENANVEYLKKKTPAQIKREIEKEVEKEVTKEIAREAINKTELEAQNIISSDDFENETSDTSVIEEIFDDSPKFELPSITTLINSKNKRRIAVLFFILTALCIFALISINGISEIFKYNKQNTAQSQYDNQDNEYYNEDEFYDEDNIPSDMQTGGQARLISSHGMGKSIDDFIIKQPITTEPTYSPTVTNVSWEAPESLIKKENYTKFLQLTGKNIKLNLQNDMLLINDVPTNKLVKIDIRIASNGDVKQVRIAKTSGSEAIDTLIKKVAKDTLKYMKPPSHGIISRPVDITLAVELY